MMVAPAAAVNKDSQWNAQSPDAVVVRVSFSATHRYRNNASRVIRHIAEKIGRHGTDLYFLPNAFP